MQEDIIHGFKLIRMSLRFCDQYLFRNSTSLKMIDKVASMQTRQVISKKKYNKAQIRRISLKKAHKKNHMHYLSHLNKRICYKKRK